MKVKYQKYRGQEGRFPIKLFYTSNMPLILQAAFVSNLYMISQLVNDRSSSSILVRVCWAAKGVLSHKWSPLSLTFA